jgi:hypothetical protein
MDLSSSLRKYSYSSPPLSNIKNESIDSIDCSSLYTKQDSTIMNKKINSSFKATKQCSNFSIEHLLSSSFQSPTYSYLKLPYKQVHSIFSKKKTKHFSDNYLHRIIHRRKEFKCEKKSYLYQYYHQPRGLFLRYIYDLYNDLINQQNQIKTQEKTLFIDPLEQLAELACKLDTRQRKSILNEDLLTSKKFDLLLNQCHLLIKQIYRKHQHKKIRKRLDYNSKLKYKKRFLQFLLSILNLLQMKKNILLYKSNHLDCHILTSDIPIEKQKMKKTIKKSICSYLKSDQINSNLEILVPNNGLLYEAVIQPIDNFDDLLLVRLNHERQTYLIPIHDLCRLACPKMIPGDFNVLSKGLRVCAYWSTSLRGLHPATVKKIPSEIDESPVISLVFDDGDTGLIKLDEIRLLPDDYNVKGMLKQFEIFIIYCDILGINLEEWRVSSFQIPSTSPTTRRNSRRVSSSASINTNSSAKKLKRAKSSSSSIVVPQWTLNPRNLTICRHDKKQTLHVGDCVVLHGVQKTLSYIGKVLKFYHNKSTDQDLVRLKWYYSPQETPIGLQENDLPVSIHMFIKIKFQILFLFF